MYDLHLNKYNDNICLISNQITLTYRQVDTICNHIQENLPSTKQLILIKAKTNIESILGYLAFLRANHAIILIDGTIDSSLLNNIVKIYKPNYVWEEKEISVKYLYEYNRYGLKENNNSNITIHPDLSLLLSTSGTTGSPKFTKLTKKNLYSNCQSIIEYLSIDQNQRAITNLPIHYSYGLSIINTHLASGASIVVSDYSIISNEFWNIFKSNNVTNISGVPYHYEIFKRIGFLKMDLPSLKFITQAGGRLNHKYVEEFALWSQIKGIKFFVMYGQTEATARIAYLPTTHTLKKPSSIGISIPYGKIRLKNTNNGELFDDSNLEGELVYFGENVMMGYADNINDLSKADELHGVLHTGDLALKDEHGFFYITGRLKRFIKMHGNRLGLDDIESYLNTLYTNIYCTGVDNLLMIAILENENIDNIKNNIINKYNIHHSSIKIKRIKEMPFTSNGKVNYNDLIKEF